MKETYNLSHLKELEAESIYIIREVASEFENWQRKPSHRVRFRSR